MRLQVLSAAGGCGTGWQLVRGLPLLTDNQALNEAVSFHDLGRQAFSGQSVADECGTPLSATDASPQDMTMPAVTKVLVGLTPAACTGRVTAKAIASIQKLRKNKQLNGGGGTALSNGEV